MRPPSLSKVRSTFLSAGQHWMAEDGFKASVRWASVLFTQASCGPLSDLNGEPCWYSVINHARYENWEDGSEEAEEDSDNDEVWNSPYTTFCGFRRAFLCPPSAPLPPQSSHLDVALLGSALPQKPQLTAEVSQCLFDPLHLWKAPELPHSLIAVDLNKATSQRVPETAAESAFLKCETLWPT